MKYDIIGCDSDRWFLMLFTEEMIKMQYKHLLELSINLKQLIGDKNRGLFHLDAFYCLYFFKTTLFGVCLTYIYQTSTFIQTHYSQSLKKTI